MYPETCAKPFLKWAGGKTQLLDEFYRRLPPWLGERDKITTYAEPFIGGGAVFFYLSQRFPFDKCWIGDVNDELILTYRVIQKSVRQLINELAILNSEYFAKNENDRQKFYYDIRDSFNDELPGFNFQNDDSSWPGRAAKVIFLNRTCYNGLFRVNRKGEFNVPFGGYKKPEILNKDNLRRVATVLKNTEIMSGDFTWCRDYSDNHTFVYLDPPYRPLNPTSSFTSYSKQGFSETDQRRLAEFFRELDEKGAKIMLSNSDPHNENYHDSFFDDLFAGYTIVRVPARRIINCNGTRRGYIDELIITNYGTGTR
jgi:DNA adenine methylase